MFRDFFVEGNREEQEWEKEGLSSKTIAMRKSSSRRARFDSGITHTNYPRENTTAWARRGTRSYDDSINRQRKEAHRVARRKKKPRPGSSPEDRQMQATWDRLIPDDRKKGKYEIMQDKKRSGQGAGIAAERNAILARGEKRRMLRTNAVTAIRRALGGGHVDESKIERISNLLSEGRKSQLASKGGRKPKEGPKSRQNDGPRAIVTVGLPGSGKSTIARHMVAQGDTDQHEFDKSRRALGMSPKDFSPELASHTFAGARRSAEQGRNTALTNTSIPRPHRQDAVKKLRDAGYENIDVVLSPGSTKAAMRRNRKRSGSKPGESEVPQFVMNRMAQGMAAIPRSELRDMRNKYKELHKKYRFTKPAMRRSGALREDKSFAEFLEEAREATRATTRGRRLNPGRTQQEVARADRRAAAAERAREAREAAAAETEQRASEIISQLRQQGEDERYAAERRQNPELLRREAQKRTQRKRMAKAAERLGIEN